jgi:hypothetical protein
MKKEKSEWIREWDITPEEASEIFRKYWPDADYKAMQILIILMWIWVLLYVLSPIIIAIERYYWIDV